MLTGLVGRFLRALSPQVDRARLVLRLGDLDALVAGIGKRLQPYTAPDIALPPQGVFRQLSQFPATLFAAMKREREVLSLAREAVSASALPFHERRGGARGLTRSCCACGADSSSQRQLMRCFASGGRCTAS